MNAIGDHVFHNATGPMPRWYRPVGGLFDQFLGAAEHDPVLAEWFLRRFSLLDSLYMVPSARLVGRTVRHNMRLWLAERRAGAAGAPRVSGAHSSQSHGARNNSVGSGDQPDGAVVGGHPAGCPRLSVNDEDFACSDLALGAQQHLRAVVSHRGVDLVAEVFVVTA